MGWHVRSPETKNGVGWLAQVCPGPRWALATCTHKRTLGVLQGLREHAVDVPDDLGDS